VRARVQGCEGASEGARVRGCEGGRVYREGKEWARETTIFNIYLDNKLKMDTHFTLVETLSKDKFAEYSDKTGLPKPNFSDEDLAKKISGDVYADPRFVFSWCRGMWWCVSCDLGMW
jgi:hypothetical protein